MIFLECPENTFVFKLFFLQEMSPDQKFFIKKGILLNLSQPLASQKRLKDNTSFDEFSKERIVT